MLDGRAVVRITYDPDLGMAVCFYPASWSHGHTGSADFGSVTPKGSSVIFGEIAWIMSLSSVSSIFVTCSAAIKDTIMKSVRTWR